MAASTAGTYTVTNAIAASGSCAASSETFNVTILAQPTATISGGGALCAGSSGSVNVNGVLTGTAPWTVVLSTPAGNQTQVVPIATVSIPVTTAGAGTYSVVTVTDATGCFNTGTGSAIVTVNPVPAVNAVSNQTVCAGATTTAINFSSATTGTTYAWTNDNVASGLAASGNGNIAAFTATNTTSSAIVSTVTVTPTANTCVGTPLTFTVTVTPGPAVTWTAPGSICVYNSALTLTEGTPAGGSFSGTGVTGSSFNPTTAGVGTHAVTYSVTESGCTGTASGNIVVSECASIEDIVASNGLAIYPNPSKGNVTFTFSNTSIDNVNLTIISAEGKVVYQNKFQTSQATIDLSTFARGTYFVRVNANDKTTTSKLILE